MTKFRRILMGLALGVFSIALSACGTFITSYANADKYVAGTQYYEGELKKLDISWISGSITLIEDETASEITVKEDNNLDEAKKVHSYFNDGTLSIKYCKSGLGFQHFFAEDKQLSVTFPSLENLVVSLTSGKLNIEKLNAKSLAISVTSGTVEIGQAEVETTSKISATSGKLIIGSYTTEKFTLSMTSGSATIDELSTDEAKFEFTSGKLTAKLKQANKVDVDITSGTIDLTIPEAGATVKIDKTSGSFSSDREHTSNKNVYTFGDGSCKVDIDMTSGKIIIR